VKQKFSMPADNAMALGKNFIYCTVTLLGFGALAMIAGPFPPIDETASATIHSEPYIFYPSESY